MKTILVLFMIILISSSHGFGQNHPDKLVFKSDAATIDSLKQTDYPYLFPFWGDKVQKLGITMPLSAGLSVNYL